MQMVVVNGGKEKTNRQNKGIVDGLEHMEMKEGVFMAFKKVLEESILN